MKIFLKLFTVIIFISTILSSCTDSTTYADELSAEKLLIADYIKRQNIKVVSTLPTVYPWPDNVYFLSKTGLYFRLTNKGDFGANKDSVENNDLVIPRYIKYTLGVKSDTTFNMTTLDEPFTSNFNFNDLTQACPGWHEAVSYMKWNNSEAKIIVKSKLDFGVDARPATPYCYDMKIKFQK
jgi:hypothetical protein